MAGGANHRRIRRQGALVGRRKDPGEENRRAPLASLFFSLDNPDALIDALCVLCGKNLNVLLVTHLPRRSLGGGGQPPQRNNNWFSRITQIRSDWTSMSLSNPHLEIFVLLSAVAENSPASTRISATASHLRIYRMRFSAQISLSGLA